MSMGWFNRIGKRRDMYGVPEKWPPYFGRNMHSNLAYGMFETI
jgi:hypothetical protein